MNKKICVLVSYNNNYAGLAKYTLSNIKNYCDLHGYHLWIDKHEDHPPIDKPQEWLVSYLKFKTATHILKNYDFDWIFYIDTDCLIMNPAIKLESLIDENYSFLVTQHAVPALDNPIITSTGVDSVISSQFFIKNSKDGLDILDAIWENKGWPDEIAKTAWDLEGRQFRILMNDSYYKDKIKAIEETKLNRFWYVNNPFIVLNIKGVNKNIWEPGDFIVHVVGYKSEERAALASDLNFFSGGLLYKWQYSNNTIVFSPAYDMKGIKIQLYNKDNNFIMQYILGDVYSSLSYSLYAPENLDREDLIIKGYNDKDELISLFYLKK